MSLFNDVNVLPCLPRFPWHANKKENSTEKAFTKSYYIQLRMSKGPSSSPIIGDAKLQFDLEDNYYRCYLEHTLKTFHNGYIYRYTVSFFPREVRDI